MIFGHQSNSGTNQDDGQPSGGPTTGSFVLSGGGSRRLPDESTSPAPAPTLPAQPAVREHTVIEPSHQNQPILREDVPALEDAPANSGQPSTEVSSAPVAVPSVEELVAAEEAVAPEPVVPTHTASDDLLALKQQALSDLTPLVGHLDQTPEERFRTTMMLLQSTDNQALIRDAYTAANNIEDEKVRAQALLDVVNEINYFTQQGASVK